MNPPTSTSKRLARHNVVAAFATIEEARDALEELHAAGIPHDELSLLSQEAKKSPGTEEPIENRANGFSPVTKAALAGFVGGGATGGVLGALLGAAVTVIPGVGLAAGAAALYAGVAGAAAGNVAGGLLGAEAGARKQMMVEQSLHPLIGLVSEGYTLVGVHSDDIGRADTGETQLEKLSPTQLERLEADETFHPPGDLAAIADRTIPSTHPESPGGAVGRDRVEHPEGALVGMEERGDSPTSGRSDAAEREKRVPSYGEDDPEN